MENFQFEDTSGQLVLFFVWSMVWVKAAVQWKLVSFCPIGSSSSHERNTRDPSDFAAKKYATKNTSGMYVLT